MGQNSTWRLRLMLAGALAVGWGWSQRTEAAKNPDTMTVSVTPNSTYGVAISSPYAAGYNFGTVTLNNTTGSTLAITVQNSGDTAEYFSLAINAQSGPWAPVAVKGAVDKFVLYSSFTVANSQPDYSTVTSTVDVTAPSTAAGQWGQASKTNATVSKYLWMKLDMPVTSSVAGQQNLTLSITGQAN